MSQSDSEPTRRELIDWSASLIERGEDLRLVVPQDTGLFTIPPERVEGVLGLLDDTIALLRAATELYEGRKRPADEAPGAGLTPQEVADLAFLGRTELLDLRDAMQLAAAGGNTWKIISEADRSVTRSIRALIPIEAALREHEGLEPVQRRWFDLDDALETRRRYVRLWLETRRGGEPSDDELAERLRHFSLEIAELRRAKIYPYLRIDDRLQLRSIQKRIFAYLEDPGDDAARDGRRLWQDMVGFFDLLTHINRREELRDHDRMLVGRLYRELYDFGSVPEHMPAETHGELEALASQEPGLDELLLRGTPSRTADYREPLGRLRHRLVESAP